jgi:hypothetical protein
MRKNCIMEIMRRSGSISVFFSAIMVMALLPSIVRAENGYVIHGTETQVTKAAADQISSPLQHKLFILPMNSVCFPCLAIKR